MMSFICSSLIGCSLACSSLIGSSSRRVMRSPQCQMDQNNLSRVFGPTLVGHGMSDPSPTTIMRDTGTQPKVRGHGVTAAAVM